MLGTQLPESLILPLPLLTDSERAGDGRQAGAGRREDAGEVGIFGRQRDGRVERLLLVVVAIDLSTISMPGYFFDLVPEGLDPERSGWPPSAGPRRSATLPLCRPCFASSIARRNGRSNSLVAWLTKNGRPSGAESASKVMTFAPSFWARFIAGTTASGSLGATAMAGTWRSARLLMMSTCALALDCGRAVVLDGAAGLLGGDLRARRAWRCSRGWWST